jgi:hypothetical protein
MVVIDWLKPLISEQVLCLYSFASSPHSVPGITQGSNPLYSPSFLHFFTFSSSICSGSDVTVNNPTNLQIFQVKDAFFLNKADLFTKFPRNLRSNKRTPSIRKIKSLVHSDLYPVTQGYNTVPYKSRASLYPDIVPSGTKGACQDQWRKERGFPVGIILFASPSVGPYLP